MMFNMKKRLISYNEIKKVNGFHHKTFMEECFFMEFLQDDHEFIETIKYHMYGILVYF